MNIPSEDELDFPSFRPLKESGFYESRFIPLYNPNVPNVVICDRDESDKGNLLFAGKGVFAVVDSQSSESEGFPVFVGSAGVTGEKATLCGDEFSRMYRVIYGDDTINQKIPNWDKAILIFDWENGIEDWLEVKQMGNFADQEKKKLIDAVMDSEVLLFEKFLYHQLMQVAKNMDLNMLNDSKPKVDLPEIDLQKFEYYVGIVKDLLQIITGQ